MVDDRLEVRALPGLYLAGDLTGLPADQERDQSRRARGPRDRRQPFGHPCRARPPGARSARLDHRGRRTSGHQRRARGQGTRLAVRGARAGQRGRKYPQFSAGQAGFRSTARHAARRRAVARRVHEGRAARQVAADRAARKAADPRGLSRRRDRAPRRRPAARCLRGPSRWTRPASSASSAPAGCCSRSAGAAARASSGSRSRSRWRTACTTLSPTRGASRASAWSIVGLGDVAMESRDRARAAAGHARRRSSYRGDEFPAWQGRAISTSCGG